MRRLIGSMAAVALLFAATASSAGAEFGVRGFDGQTTADLAGSPYTKAGGHPFEVITSIAMNLRPDGAGGETPFDNVKTMRVKLPPGLIGNPQSLTTCSEAQLNTIPTTCPVGSQVGYVELDLALLGEVTVGLYNQEPPFGSPAAFAFSVMGGGVVHLLPKIESTDEYRIAINARNVPQSLAIRSTVVHFWGIPADPVHDPFRGPGFTCYGGGPTDPEAFCSGGGFSAGIPEQGLITLPTNCSAGPTATDLEVDSWQRPGELVRASFISHLPPGHPLPPSEWGPAQGVTECERVPFQPTVTLTPTNTEAAAPTGLEMDLRVPQEGLLNPRGIAQAHVEGVRVLLPEGMTLNVSSADGLTGCAPSQITLGGSGGAACPDSSRIGTVEIETPLLDHPLSGSVFLASQGNNPFDSLVALYLAVDDPLSGTVLKLPGRVSLDPETGRVTTEFRRNPQLPFERLRVRFNGGSRAPLVNPSACGLHSARAELTDWAQPGRVVSSVSTFAIDQGCAASADFAPSFEAGSADPTAGGYSAFSLRVRNDAGPNPASIAATLPEGLLAKLAGVQLCGEAAAGSGACPPSSQVGVTDVGVGAGSNPLFVPQPGRTPTAVYLAGPYKGAPYSLVVKVPAQAGPFDLGTVAVRSKIEVDPVTTRVTVSSDPLPQILQGIPITYRDVRVNVNRGEFMLKPTSCDPMSVDGLLTSASGQVVRASDRFQVAGCERLAFKPKLRFKLSGPTRRGAHPALRATLKMPKGSANVGKAVVTLPKTQFLEQGHIRTICTRVQYAADSCPKASVYGYAKAWTPLLDQPIQGPVYLRSSNNKLPDLVADLNGQIEIDLAGRIDSVKSRMRVTFGAVPDAPVSKFVLRMQGGKKGLLVNNTELCREKPRASAVFTGHNGNRSVSSPPVKVGCGKGAARR